MSAPEVKKIDFFTLAPYVRFIHEYKGGDEYKLPPRVIYDYEIVYVINGTCRYMIENKQFILNAGDIHFMLPNIQHSSYVPAGEVFQYYAVHFDLAYMGEGLDFSPDEVYALDYPHLDYVPLQKDLVDRPLVVINGVDFPFLIHPRDPHSYIQPFSELLSIFQDKPYGYHLGMRACLLKILSFMVRDVTTEEGVLTKHSHKANITEAIQYMHNQYHETIDLQQISQSVYLSPQHFRTLFKQATGKTPIEYLTNIRLEKAKSFMLEGKYSIGQVSSMVGYQDIHYFSKLFKKVEGLSPKNYLESLQVYL